MKTSLLNGINLGTLEFNYNVRYRPRIKVTPLSMKRQIEYLFHGVDYYHIFYVWENDTYTKHKHSHSLILTNDLNFIKQLEQNIDSKKEPSIEYRTAIIQKEKNLINPITNEKIIKIVENEELVKRTNLYGKHGEVYIEPVLNTYASSIYISKQTDHGANFGYLKNPLLITEVPKSESWLKG